jgi:probable lipoprotein NlpC
MSVPSRLSILGLLLVSTAHLPGQALKVSFLQNAAPPVASLPARVVQESTSFLGVPYVRAGDSRAGMDCSGFVYRVFFDTLGATLPRGVEGLYRTTRTARMPLHIGDLLFFDTTDSAPPSVPTHVGVYIGQGRFVHAASEGTKTGVIVSTLGDRYYHDRFAGARRVLAWRDPVLDLTITDVTSRIIEVEPFASQEEVTLRVFNGMTGGGPVSLSLLKDGQQVLSRWITAGAQKPAELSFAIGVGEWSVRIARIFKGRTLSDVAFSVVE